MMTTPTDHSNSVVMNNTTTKLDEFLSNIQNMTQFRFIMFVLSIFSCFAVIISVLFFVPCEWSDCISSRKVESIWSNSVFNDIGTFYLLFDCINYIYLIII